MDEQLDLKYILYLFRITWMFFILTKNPSFNLNIESFLLNLLECMKLFKQLLLISENLYVKSQWSFGQVDWVNATTKILTNQ